MLTKLIVSTFVVLLIFQLNASPIRSRKKLTYGLKNYTKNGYYREDIAETFRQSMLIYRNFVSGLKMDETNLRREETRRQIAKQYLGMRFGSTSVLMDFHPRYF
jgi:hypothetical protein